MTAAKMAPLPCPFCGSEAKSFDRIHSAWCECTTCGAESAGQATEGEAVALWNRRAAPAAPQGEPRKAAWVNRTAAGWLQLIVAGIVIKSEYSGDWDEYATVASELNSEIFHLYAHPPAQPPQTPQSQDVAAMCDQLQWHAESVDCDESDFRSFLLNVSDMLAALAAENMRLAELAKHWNERAQKWADMGDESVSEWMREAHTLRDDRDRLRAALDGLLRMYETEHLRGSDDIDCGPEVELAREVLAARARERAAGRAAARSDPDCPRRGCTSGAKGIA